MASTTIRIDAETHARLVELSRARGTTLTATVREAMEALRREGFARRVAGELDALRSDAKGWRSYLTDAESTSVPDGIG
jgi:predicted transcriptional regulator